MSFRVPTEMKTFEKNKHLHTADSCLEGYSLTTSAVQLPLLVGMKPFPHINYFVRFRSVFVPTPSAGHSGAVCCVSANFLRKWAVSGSDDGTLRLWLLGGIETSKVRKER